MKEFVVVMPFTGTAIRTIEADSEEEAIEKFLEESTFPIISPKNDTDVEIEQIKFCREIVQGNVFWGVQNEAEAEEQ